MTPNKLAWESIEILTLVYLHNAVEQQKHRPKRFMSATKSLTTLTFGYELLPFANFPDPDWCAYRELFWLNKNTVCHKPRTAMFMCKLHKVHTSLYIVEEEKPKRVIAHKSTFPIWQFAIVCHPLEQLSSAASATVDDFPEFVTSQHTGDGEFWNDYMRWERGKDLLWGKE